MDSESQLFRKKQIQKANCFEKSVFGKPIISEKADSESQLFRKKQIQKVNCFEKSGFRKPFASKEVD